MDNMFFARLLPYFKKIGVNWTTLVLTLIATAISVGMTVLIHVLIGSSIELISIIISIVIPGLIVPVFSHLILRLTFQLHDAEEKMYFLSITDELTKVYNRRYFSQIAAQECARTKRYGVSFAILIFDIDGFKKINDTYGHLAGDHVLQAVSRICSQMIRETDVFARWGGDEFIILVRQSAEVDLDAMVKRLKQAVAREVIHFEDQDIQVTISMGGYQSGANCDDLRTIISKADKALYAAKAQGGDQFEMKQSL